MPAYCCRFKENLNQVVVFLWPRVTVCATLQSLVVGSPKAGADGNDNVVYSKETCNKNTMIQQQKQGLYITEHHRMS